MMERSRVVRVEFEVALPCAATDEQVLEWLSYGLGGGGCDTDNPLVDYDIEAISEPVLTDTRKHLRESVEVVRSDASGIYTRVVKRLQDEPSDLPPASEQSSAIVMAHYNENRQS